MKSKCFLQFIAFILTVFASAEVFATSVHADEARKWSESNGRELIDTLAEDDLQTKYKRLDDLFLNHVDLEHIGRFVMGKHWKEMTKEQKEKYIPLFKRYSLALYKSYPLQFDKDRVNFNVVNVRVEGKYTLVLANITVKDFIKTKDVSEDFKILVEFRLHKKADKILLTDLKIAETSFILAYRNRFAEMINANDGDIEWFLEDLETITVSSEKNNEMLSSMN